MASLFKSGSLFKTGILGRLGDALEPDRVLMEVMNGFIEATAVKRALDVGQETWAPGKPLKLLLAGYVGTRNTGADVRVEEMIRQFRHVIGDDELELTIMTIDPKRTAGYFRTVRQVTLPVVFPKFLFDECPKHHGVVSCEGSMFKSKFASALSTMMAGALGMAAAEHKLAVGYGAEAGAMSPALRDFVKRHCASALIQCRNEPSRDVLGRLAVRTTGGTDTAWTFEPAPKSEGAALLRAQGWDGEKKVLVVCPINPFWWPVKPDLGKAAARSLVGQFRREHYRSIYFHHTSPEADLKYDRYVDGLAYAVRQFCRDRDVFPIMVGMERVDRLACEAVSARLEAPAPCFISDDYDMFQLVSVLRNCAYMVSSRFHAIVTSMPGLVPSAGVTMDERIRNLMNDRGHPELFLEVDEEDLGEKVLAILQRLEREAEQISEDIGRVIPQQLALMGQMGIDFMDELCRVYPEFPRRDLPRTWEAHLPALSPEVRGLLEKYA
ncbi:MAG: polysaccharide pyruvyl transferase family protein [Myxococcales bacterium]|nr:polysaccharide pyruvyl transferase family protein [Myxococcales bacterium]